jgi:histidinol dehydrogenase
MKIFNINKLSKNKIAALTMRPAINMETAVATVKPILEDVKINGLKAALKYAAQFDGYSEKSISVPEREINDSGNYLDEDAKSALETAAKNIEAFHEKEKPAAFTVETMPGVLCSREFRAIGNVGLYVPGGSAVLPSTLLMLAIPAKIAGCPRIVVFSPSSSKGPEAALLYSAKLCGIKEMYTIGGAQAIALMAYGCKEIPKVDKIFGPGNQYVTASKMLVSSELGACAIDMPAGPSEVLVIAEAGANAAFIAADLLSQAEHGADSQTVFVTDSPELASTVLSEIKIQMPKLPRKLVAEKALKNSFVLVAENIQQALDFSNDYAPEHLILHVKSPEKYKTKILNAGSVFLGAYSPESAGDYASGTNHSLPTYGYAKSFGGLSVEAFMKQITFQKLTKKGLSALAPSVMSIAAIEKLDAHKQAVKIRLKK